VTGHVTIANGPLTFGNVAFLPKLQPNGAAPASRQPAFAMISGDGSYTASGLVTGDYDVRVSANSLQYSTTYTVTASATFDINMRGASLHGHVVDAASGAPVAAASVNVSARPAAVSSGSPGVSAPSYSSFAVTDSDGRFIIDSLSDATYTVVASGAQYAAATQQVVVSGGTVPDVEIRLDSAPAVTIHLVDATTGAPVEGKVFIKETGLGARIDNGTIRFFLKPGTYSAAAYAQGYLARTMTFTAPPSDVTIALQQGGSLVIHARSAQMLRLDQPTGVTQRLLGPVHEGTNGPYIDLPAGSYLLSTIGTDQRVARSVPVAIVAGQTITVEVP
jgi:hypothetical protein